MSTNNTTHTKRLLASFVLFSFFVLQAFPFGVLYADDASTTPATDTSTSSTSVPVVSDASSTSSSVDQAATSADPALVDAENTASSASEMPTTATTSDQDTATTSTMTASTSSDLPNALPDTATSSDSAAAANTATSSPLASSTPEMPVDASSTETFTPASNGGGSGSAYQETAPTPIVDGSAPAITTGNAVALANIVNIVNTNLVNSNGAIFFENLIGNSDSKLDFRGASSTCSLVQCANGSDVTVHLLNNADIANAILLSAETGGNDVSGSATSSITTGDAFAGLNLVNIANTSLVDSNYLLVTLNAFKNVNGDIVFPNIAKFFTPNASSSAPTSMHVDNSATIDNGISANTNTGGNSGGANSSISTGAAESLTNTWNAANTTLSGNTTVTILLRVHGKWAGQVFGAPEDLFSSQSGDLHAFDLTAKSTSSLAGNVDFAGTSTASILNDIGVSANTGENAIDGAGTISTGDALAALNLVNIANANVVGHNWILALINIFGDFNGNISFGMPDLWVGEQASAPAGVTNGQEITYKLSLINKGDADASSVLLSNSFFPNYMNILESSLPYTMENGRIVFDIGKLLAGGGTEITYRVRLHDAPPGTDLSSRADVSSKETDNNASDNSDTVDLRTQQMIGNGHAYGNKFAPPRYPFDTKGMPTLHVSRTTKSIEAKGFATTTEEVLVKNLLSIPIQSVVLSDKLFDPDGDLLQHEDWDLGDLRPHEEVTISYDVAFGALAKSGRYSLSTDIYAGTSTEVIYQENGELFYTAPELPTPVESTSTLPETATSTATTTPPVPFFHHGVAKKVPLPPKLPEPVPAATTTTMVTTGPILTVSKITANTGNFTPSVPDTGKAADKDPEGSLSSSIFSLFSSFFRYLSGLF